MTAVNDTLGKEIISNEVTLEHKIKSVDQNLDDKFELVIEEANSLRKNIAESIQANNKSLELFENAIETMLGVNESLWKELKIGDESIDNKIEAAVEEISDMQGTSLRPKQFFGIGNRNLVSVSGTKIKI